METATNLQARPRSPLVACLLTLLSAGLGQIYCGQLGRGLALYLVVLVTSCVGALGILPVPATWRAAALAVMGVSLILWVYAILDAHRQARRCSPSHVPKDYNRWYVYAVLAVLPLPISLAEAVVIQQGVAQAVCMRSSCMVPALHPGDRVLVSKLAYRYGPIERGDIVVLLNPDRPHELVIRRVVALAGDTVEIAAGRLRVNGEELALAPQPAPGGGVFREHNTGASYEITLPPLAASGPAASAPAGDVAALVVPHGHCFVLCDSRGQTRDSRQFGAVPFGNILGRVEWRYWPRLGDVRPREGDRPPGGR